MYQWNFKIKLQFTNFPLSFRITDRDADFQSKSDNWIPWSRSTILYLILILILIFILGEEHSTRARYRGSVWSLNQHQQQQQQPGICLDLHTYYGIVSYAVGVSLILTVAGIKSGRRFFLLFHRRHSARHTGQILGHEGRVNHRPPRDQEEPLELPVWWEAWNWPTACLPIIRIRKSLDRSRVGALLLDSESVATL